MYTYESNWSDGVLAGILKHHPTVVDPSQALEQQGKLNEVGVLVKIWIFDRLYEVDSILMIVIVIVIS